MPNSEIEDLPLGHYPMRTRSRILQKEVDKYLKEGHRIIFQTECDAQVFKSRVENAGRRTGFFAVEIIFDLFNFFVGKDSLVLIEVDELGRVTKTEMNG